MAIPIKIGTVILTVITPVLDKAWIIPQAALALWIIAVKTKPKPIPRIGFSKEVNRFKKAGSLLSPLTAPDICSMPTIKIVNPNNISPIFFFLRFFEVIIIKIPMMPIMEAKVLVEKSSRTPLLPVPI